MRAAHPRRFSSTVRPSPPTARPAGEKGGGVASHRSIPRRAHHEDPRPRRSMVPPCPTDAHWRAGPRLRRGRTLAAPPSGGRAHGDRGQGIRAATTCAIRSRGLAPTPTSRPKRTVSASCSGAPSSTETATPPYVCLDASKTSDASPPAMTAVPTSSSPPSHSPQPSATGYESRA